ncbi:hypothetical protein MUK42_27159 [Musa troglodytarum]|uniref:Uncharacterized protein n=1 Tax=Musa troglodytarum TaxID=320322 RepID=A0A9E7F4Z9_9LILI|nr:hypothetical protein MUK42_27159 [Musa troglodytarum]
MLLQKLNDIAAVKSSIANFWQQQLMCKQLQKPQRQQQLQQLDEGARHLSPHNQLSAVAKPATGNQPPATLNEMPVNDAYNYMWPSDFVGGMHNLPNNSLIFTAGNTNWVQSNISPAMPNLGKPISQVGTSSGVASLDPIEQKLLFGTDDDRFSFGGSLISSMGVDMHGHSSENDHFVAFPSIQSGSWSALMQDAVQASSSNNRLQEEWTGLYSQKSEQLMVKPPIMTNDNGKRPSAWDDRNLQNASSLTSTTVPMYNDADSILGSSTSPSDQHRFKSAHEQNNGVLTEAPHASFLSTAQGEHNSEFYHSCEQSQLSEGGLHAQRPSTSGVWSGQSIKQHDKNPGDNSLGSLRTMGPSFPPNHKFVGKTQFAGHKASSDPTIVSKMISVGAKELQSRNTMPVCASNSSFDGSTAQYSQNETISQTSNNMLELLHKVDRSRNDNSVNTSDLPAQAAAETSVTHPHFDWSSNLRGFGLRLAPPSQRQPPLKYARLSQKSIDVANNWQLDKEAGCQNQPLSNSTSSVRSVPSLDEPCKRENCVRMSSLYAQKHEEHPEANEHFIFSSAVASDIPLAGNQLQEQQHLLQQQHISSTKDHLVQQQQQQHISESTLHDVQNQSVKFSFSNQANASQLVQNSSLVRQPCDSHIMAAPGQSVQTSLPALAGRFPTPGDASFAETPVPVGSQFSSGGTDYTNSTFSSFSHTTSSGQQLPVVGTKSFSKSSISGMSQQVAFPKMLHNMWRNISPQHQQAGINRQILAANILQSIVNNDRITSLWGMPKEGDQVNKEGSATPEIGTSSANSQKEENPLWGKSLDLMHSEKVDDVCKSISASQGEAAAVIKPPLDGGSNVQISSLVHNHQHDTPCSPVLHSPLTSIASSSSDIGISGCMSKPSDVQQQNYSLLHQLQSTKASDSDVNNLIGKGPKGVGFNASQMNFNIDQRFDHRQNKIFRIPADGKVGPASHISFPPDSKPPSFASNDSDESNPSTSTAGEHDLQAHMHPTRTTSTANIMGGSDCTNIGPQMVPSWLECHGTYQKGRSVAVCDAQRSQIAAIQQYFLQKAPTTRDDNYLEQRLDSSHIGSYRQGTLATKSTPSEASPSLLPPDIMDHDVIVRSRKCKIATDVPWNKMVTEPQRLPSFSMAELDWAQAANRFIEKVDDEAETVENGPFVPQSRRRLILTTQLMHQLIPAVPAMMLKEEAAASYRSVTFTVAKSALADACSLVTSSESDSHVLLGNKNMTLGELKTSTKVENDNFSKLMEDFVGRSKKLGTDFSRLDGKTSLLDVRLECQELERFSIINRLVKFHGRTHADAVGVASTSGAYHRNIFPQRYITALPVPGNLPEGGLCLSL